MWSTTTKEEDVLLTLVELAVIKLLTYFLTALQGVHLEPLCMKFDMLLASGMSRVDQTEIIMLESTLLMWTELGITIL